jgi:hypothetical protein
MSISDILVYADPSPASGERLELAFRLAHRFGAYLIGVVPEDAAAVGDRFAKMLRQEALQGEWQMAIGLAASWVTRRAQAADLVILGQRIPDYSTGLDAPEDVILACSRPAAWHRSAIRVRRRSEWSCTGRVYAGAPRATLSGSDNAKLCRRPAASITSKPAIPLVPSST